MKVCEERGDSLKLDKKLRRKILGKLIEKSHEKWGGVINRTETIRRSLKIMNFSHSHKMKKLTSASSVKANYSTKQLSIKTSF